MASNDTTTSNASYTGTSDLITFARKELEADVERHAKATALTSGDFPKESQTGLTLDLSHRKISILPLEVITLIKDSVERLALSHNPKIAIPTQIIQCDRLRYLNLRWNQLSEFPEPVLGLNKLEILDISKNHIVAIPEAIGRMTSLKFLAAVRNQITRLPLALGDMVSLSKLKYDDNPIEFPPPDALRSPQAADGPLDKEKDICLVVKRYLRECAAKERVRPTMADEPTESSTETPRPPRRTGTGIRFPVRPSISGIDPPAEEMKMGRSRDMVPLLSSKPHTRVSSMTTAPQFRRVLTTSPLSVHDSPRDRSETISSSASVRSRRQGFVPRKMAEGESPFDFGQQIPDAANRNTVQNPTHSRVNSSVSTLSGFLIADHGGASASGPVSPVNGFNNPIRGRTQHGDRDQTRNSKRSSKVSKIGQQCQRLYVILSQLYQPLDNMVLILKNTGPLSPSTERLILNAATRLHELGQGVDRTFFLPNGRKDTLSFANKAAVNAATNVLTSYCQVIQFLKRNAFKILAPTEAFHLRNVLHQSFYSISEAHNICMNLKSDLPNVTVEACKQRQYTVGSRGTTPTQSKPINSRRLRGATILRSMSSTAGLRAVPPPMPQTNTSARSNSGAVHTGATSRAHDALSGFTAPVIAARNAPTVTATDDGRSQILRSMTDEHDTDEQFDRIFLRLKSACDLTYQSLPEYRRECSIRREHAVGANQVSIANLWSVSIHRIEAMISANNTLMSRLKIVRVKDPGIRTQKEFWQLCDSFVNAWADVGLAMQDLSKYRVDINALKSMMRPVQKAMKEVSKVISESSLYHQIVRSSAQNAPASALGPAFQSAIRLPFHSNSLAPTTHPNNYQTPVPATPLSAALGPAVQATVASMSQLALHSLEYT